MLVDPRGCHAGIDGSGSVQTYLMTSIDDPLAKAHEAVRSQPVLCRAVVEVKGRSWDSACEGGTSASH